MKLISWNVNGLRAVLKSSGGQKTLKEFLDGLGGDIICLQETKATRVSTSDHHQFPGGHFPFPCVHYTGDQLDETLYQVDGYNAYFSFCQTKKGYSGTSHCIIATL